MGGGAMKTLYPHQAAAIDRLRQSLAGGFKRPMLEIAGEVWRQVVAAPRYWVSEQGEIISTIRAGRVLRQSINPQGYPYVTLMTGGGPKKFTVHRIVAEAFVSGSGETVNHRDGDKKNNCASNLEWCSYAENNDHARDTGLTGNFGSKHYAAKLIETDIIEIRRLVRAGSLHREVAAQFGVNRQQVTKIVNGQAWRRA